jgi:YVTN family beta-propeller protein
LLIAVALVAALAGALPARADSMLPAISVDSSPRVIRVAPNGKLYVADRLPDQVSVIDPTDNSHTTVAVGVEPGAIHIGSDGRVYVPNRVSNTVSVIDSSSDTVTATIPVGLRPAAIDTPLDNSKVVVVNERSGSVTILKGDDPLLPEIVTLPVAPSQAPHALVVTPNGAKAYIADEASNDVAVIDLNAVPLPAITTRIPVGLGPGSMRIVRDEAHGRDILFVANQKDATVSRIDITPGSPTIDTVLDSVHVGDAPHGLAEEGAMVLVSNEASGTVTAMSSSGSVLRTIELRQHPLDPSGLPQRIHVTKDGKRAYVPNEGANTVSVIDLNSLTLVDTIPVGSAPTTLDISRGEVFVGNRDTNNVSVIRIEAAPVGATSTPGPTETPRPTRTPLPGETPSPTPENGVAGVDATPLPDGAPAPTDAAPDSEAIEPGLPVAARSATPTSTATAGTPTAAASRTAITGSLAPDSGAGAVAAEAATPEALSASGGAPSWVWLAAALGALAVLGAAGFAGRNRIVAYASRIRK